MTPNRLFLWGAALAVAASGALGANDQAAAKAADGPSDGSWNFQASLDGKPIGTHHFQLSQQGEHRTLVSEADFKVKIIGITAYHYHHKATEHWRGDCLNSLSSSTDDDGKPISVRSEQRGDKYEVLSPKPASATGCLMSFAYWNPAIRGQTHLLNAQTGEIEKVSISQVGSGSVQVGGKAVTATKWRISGPPEPVDVWYTAQGDWVGLDSVVGGKRKLSYRLP